MNDYEMAIASFENVQVGYDPASQQNYGVQHGYFEGNESAIETH